MSMDGYLEYWGLAEPPFSSTRTPGSHTRGETIRRDSPGCCSASPNSAGWL